jgi:hypothetical protein
MTCVACLHPSARLSDPSVRRLLDSHDVIHSSVACCLSSPLCCPHACPLSDVPEMSVLIMLFPPLLSNPPPLSWYNRAGRACRGARSCVMGPTTATWWRPASTTASRTTGEQSIQHTTGQQSLEPHGLIGADRVTWPHRSGQSSYAQSLQVALSPGHSPNEDDA